LDSSTREESELPKVLVMFPHKKAKLGIAVPIAAAPIVPIIMRIISIFLANLKSSKNETDFVCGVSFIYDVYNTIVVLVATCSICYIV
jgi:hypothetical protein